MERNVQIRGKTLVLRGYGSVDLRRMVRTYGPQVTREVLRHLCASSQGRFKRGLRMSAAS